MRHRFGVGIASALALLVGSVFAAQASAAVITGVTATSNSEYPGINRLAAYTVDGSGITAGQASNDPFGTMWLSNVGTAVINPIITFNLGGLYNLTGAQVWNYNENGGTGRGLSTVTVQEAGTDALFATIGNLTLSQATGLNTYTGQAITLSGTAQYIRFINLTSFNSPGAGGINGQSDALGLSEIQFNGTAFTQNTVPEPASLALLMVGAAGVVFIRRRQQG